MVILKINLACLFYNLDVIRQKVKTPVFAVVKADAYGHGVQLCKFIEEEVDGFVVSCDSEAIELRKLKIKKPILILSPSNKIDYFDIIYTVCSAEELSNYKGNEIAIKINSGMNRLGADEKEFEKILNKAKAEDIKISQIYTHFTSVENAENQFRYFSKIKSVVKDVPWHCCASNCLSLPSYMHGSLVRCGLAMYGYGFSGLLPIMHAYTYVVQINFVKKGMNIGYGNFVAPKDMKIAVLCAGYADGIRRFKGKKVRINGYSCEIVGDVCMDMCLADVTDAYVEKGDRAYFLDNILNAEMLAKEQQTIAYEILTLFSAKRIKRIYK